MTTDKTIEITKIIDQLHTKIDNLLEDIETATSFRCPPNMRKTFELKASWLLYRFKASKQFLLDRGQGIGTIDQNIELMRSIIDLLKQAERNLAEALKEKGEK